MTQNERLDYLLRCLLAERKEYADIRVPDEPSEKRRLLRLSLIHISEPTRLGMISYAVFCLKKKKHNKKKKQNKKKNTEIKISKIIICRSTKYRGY